MSARGDDDVDDRLDEIEEQLGQISDLLRRIVAAEGPGPEEREVEDQVEDVDMWDQGRTSTSAESLDEYRRARVRAANNDSETPPFFRSEVFESVLGEVIAYSELFVDGFENMDSVKSKLSQKKFSMFLREVLISQMRSVAAQGPGPSGVFRARVEVEGEEVENGDDGFRMPVQMETVEVEVDRVIDVVRTTLPGPSFYGVFENADGEVVFQNDRSPISLASIYGTWWYIDPTVLEEAGVVSQVRSGVVVSSPWSSLNLSRPENVEVHKGGMTLAEAISFMVEKAIRAGSAEIPDDMRDLLRLQS